MLKRLGALVTDHWISVIGAWLLLAVVLHCVAPRWENVTHDGDLSYLPARMPSAEGERLLAKAFPDNRARSQLAILVERPDGKLQSADLKWVDDLAERFVALDSELPILAIWTRNTDIVGDKLTSRAGPQGQAVAIVLQLSNEFMASDNIRVLRRVLEVMDANRSTMPEGMQTGVSGSAAIGGDMLGSANESIKRTELTTVILVVIILLLVYRAPLMAVVPLATIGIALFVSIDVLALLTQLGRVPGFEWWGFKIFTTTKIFIIVILFGAGTDFCLFLISRYKEELQRGLGGAAAIAEAVERVGEALTGSALTTICGLATMYFSDFGKFRNSGPAIGLCLLITLMACLTLAPALVRAFGTFVFWPFRVGPQSQGSLASRSMFSGFWTWAAAAILRRPGLVLVGSLCLLAPLAWEGLKVPLTYDLVNELQPNRPSVQGTEIVRRHYPAGETAPLTILAYRDGASFDQPDGVRELALLTKRLYGEGVASVRSLAAPTGDPPGYFQPFRAKGLKKLAARRHKLTKALYVTEDGELAGDVTRLDLVLNYDPFAPEAITFVNHLEKDLAALSNDQESAWHGTHFSLIGTSVGIRDLQLVTQSDQWLIQQLVLLAVLAVLVAVLRRPLICVYLILSVLFSYLVTIGATELFFAWRYGDTFYGLDWKVPIFLFVILIAVGEDYNIYLVTRVLEEQERHGPLKGLQLAIAHTGGIITSCGVIMAGTFISMMTGTLRGVSELGFALALGIMLDTCIVRPVLVPAFLALVERMRLRRGPVEEQLAAEAALAERQCVG